jgi:hypothetical protein
LATENLEAKSTVFKQTVVAEIVYILGSLGWKCPYRDKKEKTDNFSSSVFLNNCYKL